MPTEYSIRILPSARHELADLRGYQQSRVVEAICRLGSDARPRGCRKLVGTDSDYRIRIGDYRVVYFVDDASAIITIYRIRHRKDAYK